MLALHAAGKTNRMRAIFAARWRVLLENTAEILPFSFFPILALLLLFRGHRGSPRAIPLAQHAEIFFPLVWLFA
jgi:hypothetical protein